MTTAAIRAKTDAQLEADLAAYKEAYGVTIGRANRLGDVIAALEDERARRLEVDLSPLLAAIERDIIQRAAVEALYGSWKQPTYIVDSAGLTWRFYR